MLVTATPAQGAWWDCLCLLGKRDCTAKVMPPAVHQNAAPNLEAASIGARVELQLGKKTVAGVLLDATYEGILLGTMRDGKPQSRLVEHRKIDSLSVIDPVSGELEAFGIDTPRARVLASRLLARRRYIDFLNTDYVAPVQEAITAEVLKFRDVKSKAEQESYLRAEGEKIMARVREKFGIDNVGFHYNLNGGNGSDYVERGGLRVSRGDVGVQYGASKDFADKIYLFQSKTTNLFDVINATNPKLLAGGRMGYELNIFRLDHEYFRQAVREGGITKATDISFDFNTDWLRRREFNKVGAGLVGIPYSMYLAPPIGVFQSTGKRFPALKRLSRLEETLVTMRRLEAILLSDKNFLPAGEGP